MEILTIQNCFLGHMEAHRDSQAPFLITAKIHFSSALFQKKKKVSKVIATFLRCTVAVHHMTCQKGHQLPWYDTGHISSFFHFL